MVLSLFFFWCISIVSKSQAPIQYALSLCQWNRWIVANVKHLLLFYLIFSISTIYPNSDEKINLWNELTHTVLFLWEISGLSLPSEAEPHWKHLNLLTLMHEGMKSELEVNYFISQTFPIHHNFNFILIYSWTPTVNLFKKYDKLPTAQRKLI